MKYLFVFLAVFLLFFSSNSYGGGELFTWKDAEGGLHITDERPPDGVKILDITPSSDTEAAKKIQRQKKISKRQTVQENERRAILRQVAEARQREGAARRKAEEFAREADDARQKIEELRNSRKYRRKSPRFKRKMGKFEKKAEEMLKKAERYRKLAESLEKKLEN